MLTPDTPSVYLFIPKTVDLVDGLWDDVRAVAEQPEAVVRLGARSDLWADVQHPLESRRATADCDMTNFD